MFKKVFILIILLFILGGVFLATESRLPFGNIVQIDISKSELSVSLEEALPVIKKPIQEAPTPIAVEEIPKEQLPEPLVKPEEISSSKTASEIVESVIGALIPSTLDTALDITSIINWTNIHRVENGFMSLQENSLLNKAAAVKATDILARQYFEHTNPDGRGASDLASDEGYTYVTIGENLALGGFKDSQDVVQAWMDSPGHRANILKSSYEEIGVSSIKGIYEGRNVWVSVQIFGRPLSSCPALDKSLADRIEIYKEEVEQLSITIDGAKLELENMSLKGGPAYNKKVSEYNTIVKLVNGLIVELKEFIVTYNLQVNDFNICVGEGS